GFRQRILVKTVIGGFKIVRSPAIVFVPGGPGYNFPGIQIVAYFFEALVMVFCAIYSAGISMRRLRRRKLIAFVVIRRIIGLQTFLRSLVYRLYCLQHTVALVRPCI